MNIKIQELKKTYGNLEIFDNFNIEIQSAALTCLYGGSGCGKTTLLNRIGMIEPYDSGNIYYDGIKISRQKDIQHYLAYKIGFIFQNFGLVDNLTVIQNIKISKQNKHLSDCQINEALNKFGLIDILNKKIFELSGGEQQRVALTKVYLKNVDLILADEPTASLDEENANLVMNTLREFARLGKTIVIVSHDKNIRDFCDYSYNISNKQSF